MQRPSSILVVGAGAAGAQVILALRRLGYDKRIDLVGEERFAPYERPPLSKELLMSQQESEPTWLLNPTMMSELSINACFGHSVLSIDLPNGNAVLADQRRLAFDRLVLTTGASPRVLGLPGAKLEGVFYLRSLDDARRIREAFLRRQPVVVIGGGFIGLEVAAAARMIGCTVTVVEAGAQLMGRAVPKAIAGIFAQEHRRQGVSVEVGRRPVRFAGSGSVEAVELDDGRWLPAGAVLIGIGVVPQCALAEQMGVMIDDGIVVDIDGRTSVENVFAAGDCCRVSVGETRGTRSEAWQSALDQGDRVAHAILGLQRPPMSSIWMWSNQYDHQLQAAGAPSLIDDIVYRGDARRAKLICFQLFRGRLVGAVAVNRNSDLAVVRRVLPSAPAVDSLHLSDESWPLRQLLTRQSEPTPSAGN